jgi:hypothetical protein
MEKSRRPYPLHQCETEASTYLLLPLRISAPPRVLLRRCYTTLDQHPVNDGV